MFYMLALLMASAVSPEDCVGLAELDAQAIRNIDGTRYLALHHIPKEKREDYFKAVSYVLNSLSSNKKIVLPVSVDGENNLIRFNIHDYRLSKEGYDALGKNRIFKTQKLEAMLGCENPILKVDYFIVNAMSAPAYYKLMRVTDLNSFRKKVDFDPEDRAKTLQGAVIANSNLSFYSRQARRYNTVVGAMWEARDSRKTDYVRNLLSDDFDSIQVITSNPNGLLSYFAGDSKGRALEYLDVNINVDFTRVLPDSTVHVSRNCLFCHAAKGVLPFKDVIRELAPDITVLSVDQQQAERIIDLFGSKLPFEKDKDDYQKALMEATGIEPSAFQEKLIKIYQKYYSDLTLEEAAIELGVKTDDLKQICRFSTDVYLLSLFKFDKISRLRFEEVIKDW